MTQPIDIVVLWVNGNDPDWQRRYNQYAPEDKQIDIDASEERYRDWDCLRYWFRGIEQFAPWARRVHLVTSGEKPDWLNLDCPRLNWVKHEDFMPADYLPTFSSHAIENNLHRIEGLSEQFIYFNDDLYLLRPATPERFFRGGLPTDMAVVNTLQSDGQMGHITLNDLDVINHHFRKRQVLRRLGQWFTPRYGLYLLRTLALLPWPRFSGLLDHHLPQGYLKHTFREVWDAEPALLDATCRHRFRHAGDVNQWLFRYWHLATGQFAPLNVMHDSVVYKLDDANFADAMETIRHQRKRVLVLNDSDKITDFAAKRQQMQAAFEAVLSQKSCFEK